MNKMYCSPLNLLVDATLWTNPTFSHALLASYQNYTPGKPYDCGLSTVPCNSSFNKGYTDSSVAFWFNVIAIYGLMTILVLLGLTGNIINIVIFSRYNIANGSTNTLLLCVSVVDLMIALNNSALVITFYMCFVDVALALTSFNLVITLVYRQLAWFPALGLDIVNVIAMQRATAVIFPFKVSKIFSLKVVKIIIVILFSFTFITLIPLYYASYGRWFYHPYFNKRISLGNLYRIPHATSYAFVDYYLTIRNSIGLPLLAISVTLTIIKLKLQTRTRSGLKATTESSKSEKGKEDNDTAKMSTRERKTVQMSLAVCIMTFILYLLPTIASAISLRIVDMDRATEEPIIMIIYFAGQLPMHAMACFNFFLYMIMSPQYRECLLSICQPLKRRTVK